MAAERLHPAWRALPCPPTAAVVTLGRRLSHGALAPSSQRIVTYRQQRRSCGSGTLVWMIVTYPVKLLAKFVTMSIMAGCQSSDK